MPLASVANLSWYGPASMCIEDQGGEEPELSPSMLKSASAETEADGGNPSMHVTKLRGWGLETEGQGDIEQFAPRKRARVLVDMDIAAQPSVFEIVQGVWNAQAAQYSVAGTMGAKVNSAASGGVDYNALAQAVWDYTTRTLTAGSTPEQIALAVHDYVIDNGLSHSDLVKVMASVLAGKVTGAGTGTETFKGMDGVTDRVVVTVDNNGNRSDVVINGN